MVPVEVPGGKGKPSIIVDKDESLDKFDVDKMRKLPTVFKVNGGTVTAGNASSMRSVFYLKEYAICHCHDGAVFTRNELALVCNDGAAALVLVSGEMALKLGLQVIARIRGYADAAQAPEYFPTPPSLAIPKAISNAGLDVSQIDFYDINEAFSVVTLSNQKQFHPIEVAVALSMFHPIEVVVGVQDYFVECTPITVKKTISSTASGHPKCSPPMSHHG